MLLWLFFLFLQKIKTLPFSNLTSLNFIYLEVSWLLDFEYLNVFFGKLKLKKMPKFETLSALRGLKMIFSSQYTGGGTKTTKVIDRKRQHESDTSMSSQEGSPKLSQPKQKTTPKGLGSGGRKSNAKKPKNTPKKHVL